ncbi:hypothetical protein PHLGIDRAFT_497817 [Phlebiopsis gigantea 11061_1 CR5-6]|uniref:Uncharacterized protein n=1 Tax=Phlebiopsis gigantea (strain 11061_1 CR5-6) TaxID=745531 RepID=A0A0C3SBU3_PHLG1|nr:hypothetical protein PHLGIDRAFT_497817 [Phlebiopsis gigantea 11061_1 CR5-6]
MRFFSSSKSTIRPAKKPTVTVKSYNLGMGFEERHKLVPVAAARHKAHVVYRPLALPAEELVVARRSPLEELACWAAQGALEERRASPQPAATSPRERTPSLLSGAFYADVEDEDEDEDEEDLCLRYSPENNVKEFEPVLRSPRSSPRSPVDSELEEWLRSRPEIVLATTVVDKLALLEDAEKRSGLKYHVEGFQMMRKMF